VSDSITPLPTYIATQAKLLADVGIESSKAEVEWILCHVLDVDRLNLYLHGQKLLGDEERRRIDEIINSRLTRHPLQFILNESYFYGRKFYVNENVMAPTPETEGLCEAAIKFIIANKIDSPHILDLGTGSGVIAVTIASEMIDAKVVAVELSDKALTVAKRNSDNHNLSNQVEFRLSDMFSSINKNEKYDLILSNPPYICEPDYDGLPPEVLADPKLAMTSGVDGLNAIRKIVRQGPDYLKKKGRIMFEIGYGQAEQISKLVEDNDRYTSMTFIKDLNDIDRIAILGVEKN